MNKTESMIQRNANPNIVKIRLTNEDLRQKARKLEKEYPDDVEIVADLATFTDIYIPTNWISIIPEVKE